MADMIVDTYKLKQYAQRISDVNRRVKRLDHRLDALYFQVGLQGLFDLMRLDAMVNYSYRLVQCQSYLQQTATELEKTEKLLQKQDPLQFAGSSWENFQEKMTEKLTEVWKEIKQRLKQLGFAEDMIDAFLNEEFGDKPDFISALGFLTKIEKILSIDPSSWNSISDAGDQLIDAFEAILKLDGTLETWVETGTGLKGAEAGLLLDLIVADLKNAVENAEECTYKILNLIQNPDATFVDYVNAFFEIKYKLTDGVILEGFLDVVFEKADIIGSIFGLDKYIESKTGGQSSSVKDVYVEFWEMLNEYPKETLNALWDNITEQRTRPFGLMPNTKCWWII